MDIDVNDGDLVARLKRLDAAAAPNVGYDYGTLIDRHADRQRRSRRRQAIARGTATALVVSMLGISLFESDRQLGDEFPVRPGTACRPVVGGCRGRRVHQLVGDLPEFWPLTAVGSELQDGSGKCECPFTKVVRGHAPSEGTNRATCLNW